MMSLKKILVIQTAFIGDAILATSVLEKLHIHYPNSKIDFLVRKGNEALFENHPFINKLWIWDKKKNKLKNQFLLIRDFRKQHYDYIINCQRYFSTGLFTVFSGAKNTIGFDSNPLSLFFSISVKHAFDGLHETQRNQRLIASFTDSVASKPKLYIDNIKIEHNSKNFITISPSSVWFTKQYPKELWIEFINKVPQDFDIFLLGSPADKSYNHEIMDSSSRKDGIFNKAGELSLLQSAALMKQALMNYVNDSAPLHLCSAVNAPVCVMYCSTLPAFGFGPLSDKSYILETEEKLDCRPCGIHGHKACPQGHFKCGYGIRVNRLIELLPKL